MTSNQEHITRLIDRYFDGATTLPEEEELRRIASDPEACGGKLDELRAVMSFAAVTPREKATAKRGHTYTRHILAIGSAAAAVTIIAMAGWWISTMPGTDGKSECMAYVDGQEISDPNQVMKIVNSDLAALGEAASGLTDDVTDELDAISAAMRNVPDSDTDSDADRI